MTPQQIDTMKQALEALQGLIKKTSGQSIYSFMETERRIAMSACVFIKEALADHAMQEVQRLGQEIEQEPVAVVDVHEFYDNCANFSLLKKLPKGKHTLYTTPPQPERHELQAKGEHPAPCARHCEANAFQIVIKNLKAQLAQRKPLTDEEIMDACDSTGWIAPQSVAIDLARAIEAAHGIKENT